MQRPEVCPYQIGSRAKVRPTYPHAGDWKGSYVVVAIMWEYDRGDGAAINIALASDDDIKHRSGWTDGWRIDDLMPA